jgi:hypothetical protein
MEKVTVWSGEILIGKFYDTTGVPTLEETEPALEAGLMISRDLYIPRLRQAPRGRADVGVILSAG